jgi:hypothetical protein
MLRTILALCVVVVTFVGVRGRAEQARGASRAGSKPAAGQIRPCPRGTVDDYLLDQWQRCWFDAANGRWRTLSDDTHYDTLVVQVEAASLADAEEIARRFVKVHGERYPLEILIYVHQETQAPTRTVRRVTWSARSGFRTLDFEDTSKP